MYTKVQRILIEASPINCELRMRIIVFQLSNNN